jgi:hypothetical protein
MHRVFALDVPTCPRCGGRLRVIATVQDPAVMRATLANLGLAPGPDSPGPAPARPHRGHRVTLPPAARRTSQRSARSTPAPAARAGVCPAPAARSRGP